MWLSSGERLSVQLMNRVRRPVKSRSTGSTVLLQPWGVTSHERVRTGGEGRSPPVRRYSGQPACAQVAVTVTVNPPLPDVRLTVTVQPEPPPVGTEADTFTGTVLW